MRNVRPFCVLYIVIVIKARTKYVGLVVRIGMISVHITFWKNPEREHRWEGSIDDTCNVRIKVNWRCIRETIVAVEKL
jgi:hypothetical protein